MAGRSPSFMFSIKIESSGAVVLFMTRLCCPSLW